MMRATGGCSSMRGGNGGDPKTGGCRGPPVVDKRYGEAGGGGRSNRRGGDQEEGLASRGDSGLLTATEAK
jgi:hypothetical protein